jgi:hypothetical protein
MNLSGFLSSCAPLIKSADLAILRLDWQSGHYRLAFMY